jgi:hypothetical protein
MPWPRFDLTDICRMPSNRVPRNDPVRTRTGPIRRTRSERFRIARLSSRLMVRSARLYRQRKTLTRAGRRPKAVIFDTLSNSARSMRIPRRLQFRASHFRGVLAAGRLLWLGLDCIALESVRRTGSSSEQYVLDRASALQTQMAYQPPGLDTINFPAPHALVRGLSACPHRPYGGMTCEIRCFLPHSLQWRHSASLPAQRVLSQTAR